MMYCTTRIVGVNANGAAFKTGTGFFYQFPVAAGDDRNVPILVTNKHVVEGIAYADFVVHTNSSAGDKPDGMGSVRSQLADWVPHPDPKVDLCAVAVGGALNQAKAFYRALDPPSYPLMPNWKS